ncbi:ABC transporter ATP-binding/permease protein YojI [Pseudoalteromonas holothuriae]|uniref:ABC transporter ATP-binding/permease protein YojI n=1 Tax=Pseudoalteromonas holothuriae TaxID=2963714 RepID=A0A9W4QTQ4_9GAMM|nr:MULTISPECIES: cyclic peptide export ABC transporter [unclassified Pseudoalteromonas]CAH9050334.1 ABC transporter ATP-binding/permease protein YojI [Pseudoalteromonas sp. CIP111951]CAH9052344.1 ABC transporter ATP-binding/permease protein YojI [Pseudoalteromonas sp. CIP111854]
MKLFSSISKRVFMVTLLFSVLVSIFPAVISIRLLADIGQAISQIGRSDKVMAMGPAYYAGLVMIVMLLTIVSRFLMSRFKEDVLMALREKAVQKVLGSTLQNIEKIGVAKLYNLLTEDVGLISSLFATLPHLIFNFLLIVIGFIYIGHLSIDMLVLLSSLTLAAALISSLIQRSVQRETFNERGMKDKLYQLYESIIYGKKELSLSYTRTNYLHNSQLSVLIKQLKAKVISLDLKWSGLITFGDSMVLMIILSMLLMAGHVEVEVLSVTVLIIFYLRGAVATIMSSLPTLLYAKVAFNRLSALSQFADEPFSARPSSLNEVNELSYKELYFSYEDEQHRPTFQLGPLNIVFQKGEVTMLNGGNGSGKSTLCKLIAGLYPYHSGAVYIDGTEVTEQDQLRSLYSCQLFDFYLFKDLPVEERKLSQAQLEFVHDFLAELQLEHVVSIHGNEWNSTNLSSGQKRRLALIATLFESKPVVLFDEWAADQDPHFRGFFYRTLLPRLAQQNKIVIVVSHDEHYFSFADKIYTLREGKLVAGALQDKPVLEHV